MEPSIMRSRFNISLLLFLYHIFLAVSEEVILFDSTTLTTDLNWDTHSDRPSGGNGNGWYEESWMGFDPKSTVTNYRVVNSCSMQDGLFDENAYGNMIFPPSINVDGFDKVTMELTYHLRCAAAPECKETFTMYTRESDVLRHDNFAQMDNATFYDTMKDWSKAKVITHSRSNRPEHFKRDVSFTKIPIKIKKGAKFLQFAFAEQYACVSVMGIKVVYTQCGLTRTQNAIFPATRPRESSDVVKAEGKCVEHALTQSRDKPVGFCTVNGNWNVLPPYGVCLCEPGYYADVVNNLDACLPCDEGKFKSKLANENCSSCPLNSQTSGRASVVCACNFQHYRLRNAKPNDPCYRVPSKPLNVQVKQMNQTMVQLEWRPPSDLGGRLEVWYDWECSADGNGCEGVRAHPADRPLHSQAVKIERLQPDTQYLFRIVAKNKVSEVSGMPAAYTRVDVRTLPEYKVRNLHRSAVSDGGRMLIIQWTAPEVSNGADVGYEVEVLTPNAKQHYHKELKRVATNEFRMEQMQEHKKYRFRVRAIVDNTESPFSDWVEYQVGDAPDPQENSSARSAVESLPLWVLAVGTLLLILLLLFALLICRRSSKNRKQMSDLDVLDTYKQDTMTPDYNTTHRQFNDMFRAAKISAPLIPTYGSAVSQPPPYYGNCGIKFKPYVDPTAYEDPNQALVEFTFDIDPAAVFITQVIGGGEFGDVCMGGLRRSSAAGGINNGAFDSESETVAIKTLKPGSSSKAKADFLLEASIMGQFAHPNVIRLIGVVTQSEPVMIVTEFMANGSLDQLLRTRDARGEELGWNRIADMLRGIAAGMKYLTDKGYVHRDLAARNVLVDAELSCKIADFGLSRGVDDSAEQEYTTNGGKIPVRWTAPEAITHRKFTASSDVWSFGVLVWEVCSFGERPYWDWTNQKVISEIMGGYRLPAPMDCPQSFHRLMLWCWRLERHERPSFTQLLAILEKYCRQPELIHTDSTLSTRPTHSSVNNAYGTRGPPPTTAPPTPSLDEFLRSLGMTHVLERLRSDGVQTVHDLAQKSHLDLLALGLISEEFGRIRDALAQLRLPRGAPHAEATLRRPSPHNTPHAPRRDEGFFV